MATRLMDLCECIVGHLTCSTSDPYLPIGVEGSLLSNIINQTKRPEAASPGAKLLGLSTEETFPQYSRVNGSRVSYTQLVTMVLQQAGVQLSHSGTILNQSTT